MDVFISYSSKDRPLVREVCQMLKENQITYWVDYENDQFGSNYSAEIITNIRIAKVMLLFVTEASNQSSQVLREVNYGVNHNIPILPVVVGEVALSPEFEYYLSATHLLTYSSGDFSKRLLGRLQELLHPGAPLPEENRTRIQGEAYTAKKKALAVPKIALAILAGVLILALVFLVISQAIHRQEPDSSEPASSVGLVDSQNPPPTEQSLSSTASTTASQPESSVAVPKGKNQIPAKYDSLVEAFEYQDSQTQNLKTVRLRVGEKNTPTVATVWKDCELLSQNTAVAIGQNNTIVAIAPGETYIMVLSSVGSEYLLKVIVE